MLTPYFNQHYPWLGAYVDANFEMLVSLYLVLGFIAGIVLLKIGGSESPVGTLLMMMFCWGIIALFAPFVFLWVLIGWFLSLLGIEAEEGDSHGC